MSTGSDGVEWCGLSEHAKTGNYWVLFRLECGYVIVNPDGHESVLGHTSERAASAQCDGLNAAITKGAKA